MALLNNISLGLNSKAGQCDFDRIFSYPRIINSGISIEQSNKWSDNCKRTALSIINHYKTEYGDDFLEEFKEREELWAQFPRRLINQYSYPETFFRIIKEDLRSPYYQNLFSNKQSFSLCDLDNDQLIESITADLNSELSNIDNHFLWEACHLQNGL